MALRKVGIPIAFRGGLETKLDDKTVPTTKLLLLENARFVRGGTLAKRFGFEALPTDVIDSVEPLSGGKALATRDEELLYLTDRKLLTFSEGVAKWGEVGDVQSVVVTDDVVAKTTSDQKVADCAQLSGVAVYAWEDSLGGVFFAIVDATSLKSILRPTLLSATGTRPRVHAVGSVLHVYFAEEATNDILVQQVNPDNPELSFTPAPTVLINDLSSTTPWYDVDGSLQTEAVIAWKVDGSTLRLGFVHQSGALGTPSNGLPSAVTVIASTLLGGVAVNPVQANRIALVYGDAATAASGEIYDALLVKQGSTVTLDSAADAPTNMSVAFQRDLDSDGDESAHAYWEHDATADQDYRVEHRTYNETGTLGTVRVQRSAGLASKAFSRAQDVYANLVHDTTLFTTYLTQRSDGLIVARMLPGVAGGLVAKTHLPSVQSVGDTRRWAGIYVVALGGVDGDQFTESGIRALQLDFDSSASHQAAQIGLSTYVGGGMLQVYDGARVVESGFHVAPDEIAAPVLAGGAIPNGTYLYRFVYEDTNNVGELIQSGVSAGTEVVISAGPNNVTFTIPTLRLTARAGARIAVFRSEDGDSAILFRVTDLDPNNDTGDNRYIVNDPTVDSVSFTDNLADAALIKREPLYTVGGVLSNDPPPSGSLVTTGKNRLFQNDPSDPLLVRFGQELREGYEVELATRLLLKLDPFGEDITALIVMDDAVVVFKETAVFFFAGPGPLANPSAGGGFSAPQLITSDVGCVNARSVAYTPRGVVFQSRKGIYLLDRGRAVSYIGAPVERFTDPSRLGQTIVDANLVEDRTEVRFLTDSGQSLIWDYFFDQWSSSTNSEGKSAVVSQQVYHYLRNDGRVFKETANLYQDDNAQIPMVIETAWIKLQQILQGFHYIRHVYIIGEFRSTHLLKVGVQFDYEDGFISTQRLDPDDFINITTFGEDATFGDAALFGGENVKRYQFKIHVGTKCEAFRLRFEDIEPTGDFGASFELTELLVTGGVKRRDFVLGGDRSA